MAFLIADNKLIENGSWNERMLGEQLKIFSELELDFDLEAVSFNFTNLLNQEFVAGGQAFESPVGDFFYREFESSFPIGPGPNCHSNN